MHQYFCIAITIILMMPAIARADAVTVTVDRTRVQAVSRLELGVTHTQNAFDGYGAPAAVQRAMPLLQSAARYQNVHIMGWGADNPQPSPGVYNWQSLDRRIALVRQMKAQLVITLCAAPDWMKGGVAGNTDWSRIEAAPTPDHYGDFAELARAVAKRYPDARYFQVWNEFKGFWSSADNNWDYRAYTQLYNRVYDALKAVNPAIKVGGPYLVIEGTGSKRGGWAAEQPITARQWTILDYWLKSKHGADFLCVDRGIIDFHDANSYTDADKMDLTYTFGEVVRQLRAKTDLPIWWAEYYGAHNPDNLDYTAANYASILRGMALNGCSVALLWQPQANDASLPGIFTDTRKPDGGQPLPLLAVCQAYSRYFGKGAKLYRTVSSSPHVEALATANKLLLINKTDSEQVVRCGASKVVLKRYEVLLRDR